ncbi:MAG: hypothetical protein M0P13_11925 [Fibrobacteraceae bacterium]|nr:hypothetical protein [Fibrobacteraceae bacterium]
MEKILFSFDFYKKDSYKRPKQTMERDSDLESMSKAKIRLFKKYRECTESPTKTTALEVYYLNKNCSMGRFAGPLDYRNGV